MIIQVFSNKLSRRCVAVFVLAVVTVLTGCNMYEPIVKEMELAYLEAGQSGGGKHEQTKAAISRAVEKHFPTGMNAEEALKALRQLGQQGFDVAEYRHEGARHWPDGELKPYVDEETKRHLQLRYPKGMSEFTAHKQYGRRLVIIEKHAVIRFQIIDGSNAITSVEGDLWASSI